MSVTKHHAALPTGKELPVPIGYEAGFAPESIWRRLRREQFPGPAGNRAPARRLVVMLAELFQPLVIHWC